jgi:Flp pilus assembly protein CpaB
MPARRRLRRRPSATHILIAVVVILAFVLNLLVLRDRSSTTLVAVARHQLTTGSVLGPDSVRLIPVESDFESLDHLITDESLGSYDGWVLRRAIDEGALLDVSSLVQPGDGSGLRSMSLPVDREHAAGGSLVAGDRVDVISVVDGEAGFVASDLEVTGVAEDSSGGIGAVSQYHIVLSVSADQALALAAALDSDSLEIVRSTGAETIDSVTAEDDGT